MFSDKSNCNQNSRPDMLPSTIVEINQFGCKLTKEDTLQDFEFVKTGFVDSSILNFFFFFYPMSTLKDTAPFTSLMVN